MVRRKNDFHVMLSSILLIIAVFGIILTTGEPQTGSLVVDSPQLSQLDHDEVEICKDAGGKPYYVGSRESANGIEIRCNLSAFDTQLL